MEQRNAGCYTRVHRRGEAGPPWEGERLKKDKGLCVFVCAYVSVQKRQDRRMSSADPVFNHKVAPKNLEF